MKFEIYEYTIAYIAGNGPPEQVTATRQHIADGVLHLFYKSGPGLFDEQHAGSWPLSSIRSWKRVEK